MAIARPVVRVSDAAVVTVVVGALLALYVIADLGHQYDDPWILYRYADNLLAGHGWTFNPGEASPNAATSTGYVVALAALGLAGLPIPAAGTVLFVVGLAAACGFTFVTYRGRGGAAGAVLLAMSPQLVEVRGMETPLMLAAAAATIWAADRRLDVAAGLLLVLAATVRPDMVLLAPVLFFWRRVVEGRWPWKMATAAAVAGGLYGVTMLATVGLPSTLSAKIVQGASGLFPTFTGTAGDVVSGPLTWWVVVAVGMALNRQWLRQPAVWLAVLFLAFYVGVGVAFYPWYWAIPVYAVAVAAGAGLERVRVAPLVVVAGLSLVVVSGGLPQDRAEQAAAGRWIAANAPAGATVGTSEIGLVGWHSGRTVVGHLGLVGPVDREALTPGTMGRWVDRQRPDYLVVNRALGLLDTEGEHVARSLGYRLVWAEGDLRVWSSPS